MLHDIEITPAQAKALGDWAVVGDWAEPDEGAFAPVQLALTGDVLTARQGDEYMGWTADGEPVDVPRRRQRVERLRVAYDVKRTDVVGVLENCRRFCAVAAPRGDRPAGMASFATFEDAAEFLGDAVLDGEHPEAIFDLDTGERIEVHIARPRITKSEDQGVMINPLADEGNRP